MHELRRTRTKAPFAKLSAFFLNFSPFAFLKKFNNELNSEELAADAFTTKIQGTTKYLNTAKKKVTAF
ncbi:MAG: hypothetical protein ABIF85_06900 [Nanoarchaeota archaeon]|nr:hypothetical protein [Nanoarchaeota archaeon]MBU4451683.1 hypothetical protein [Nanoarchaeota archaeon]MCG2723612.1 hypothetical protein [archaeon]